MNQRTITRADLAFWGSAVLAMLAGCGASATKTSPTTMPSTNDTETPAAQPAPQPKPLYALSYIAGASWKEGKSPQEQDLAAHFAYADELFKEGKLVVNGLYGDEVRGLYVFGVASEDDVRTIVANDPGVQNGTLAADGITPWLVMWDGLGAEEPPGTLFFVIEYGPGSSWVQGRPATEQNLKEHFAYVTAKQQAGVVVAAGPIVGTDHGRYIVAVASKPEADAYVAADPGVRTDVVTPISIRPWAPVHRQTQANATIARGGT